MFEKHKAKKAEEQYKSEMEAWQSEHDELTAVLQAATTRTGSPTPTDNGLTPPSTPTDSYRPGTDGRDSQSRSRTARDRRGLGIPVRHFRVTRSFAGFRSYSHSPHISVVYNKASVSAK
jgi:hypothetical protein